MNKFIALLSDYIGNNLLFRNGNKLLIVDPKTMELLETLPIIRYTTTTEYSQMAVYSGLYGKYLYDMPKYFYMEQITFHGEAEESIPSEKPMKMVPRIGAKIHLHSKRGMYTVEAIFSEYMKIYSNTRGSFNVHITDFKCLAGGMHNMHLK